MTRPTLEQALEQTRALLERIDPHCWLCNWETRELTRDGLCVDCAYDQSLALADEDADDDDDRE